MLTLQLFRLYEEKAEQALAELNTARSAVGIALAKIDKLRPLQTYFKVVLCQSCQGAGFLHHISQDRCAVEECGQCKGSGLNPINDEKTTP
jgi:hypothetical protein